MICENDQESDNFKWTFFWWSAVRQLKLARMPRSPAKTFSITNAAAHHWCSDQGQSLHVRNAAVSSIASILHRLRVITQAVIQASMTGHSCNA